MGYLPDTLWDLREGRNIVTYRITDYPPYGEWGHEAHDITEADPHTSESTYRKS